MFKYNNNTLPESISELFVPYTAIHTYNTRNKHNLRPKQSNRAYIRMCYVILACILSTPYVNHKHKPHWQCYCVVHIKLF